MPSDIRLTAAHLSGRRLRRFQEAAALLDASVEAGRIANPAYTELRQEMNRSFEIAWEAGILGRGTPAAAGPRPQMPSEVASLVAFDRPSLQSAGRMLGRIAASPVRHPLLEEAQPLLQEMACLARQVAGLKDQVVKRQVRAVEDRKPGYAPPRTTGPAQARVLALLEEITAAAHAGLQQWFKTWTVGRLESYLAADMQERSQGRPSLDLYSYNCTRRHGHFDPYAYEQLVRLVEGGINGIVPSARPGIAAAVAAMALEYADAMRSDFVHKNFSKLASIVDAKGNLERGEVLGRDIDLGGLQGTLKFIFADGSSFVARNAVVRSHSIHGKPFLRYPLTFHDALLPDGSYMPRPDEQRMNEEFAKAAAAPAARLP